MKRTLAFIMVICMLACMATTAYASPTTQPESESLYAELPIYDTLADAVSAANANQSRTARGYGSITPSLVRRSSSSTTVYLYLVYSGSYSPDYICYTQVKVTSLVPLTPTVYATFEDDGDDVYVSLSGDEAYIGSMSIPTGKTSAIVKTSGLGCYINGVERAVTNISGTWSIS